MSRRSRKSRGREVHGIFLLDKPAGLTSNAALQEVKRSFKAAKAGHTGSLDPLATGVLCLCFGEATKFSQFLLDADKHYLTRIKLGVTTDTGDADGEVLETRPVPDITDQQLACLLDKYRGEIYQTPSMYSALKVDGQPLYKLARQGIEVERQARLITVHSLAASWCDHGEMQLDIKCSKGTYIRTLAEDMGEDLGCGAHVTSLRRLAVGPFKADETVSLDELQDIEDMAEKDRLLLPINSAVQAWPSVHLTALTASYLRQGQPVQVANAPTEGWVSIFIEAETGDPKFIGAGEIQDDGKIAPRRLLASH